jgi:hypothetical protein
VNSNYILDPMWIIKKDYVDAEYSSYVLLAAQQKYDKELKKGNQEYYYEILFNYLNLNNLVLDGNMFDFKMKPSWKDSRIIKISKELSSFYKNDNQSGEIIRQANDVLSTLAIACLNAQCEIFNIRKFNVYYVNNQIQMLNNIYVIININGKSKYEIWRLRMDKRFLWGHDFKKLETLEIENIEETPIKEKLEEIDNPELTKMHPDLNLLFCICKDSLVNTDQIADSIKNTILLNKLMGNDSRFDPNLLENALDIIVDERILPFKISEQFL